MVPVQMTSLPLLDALLRPECYPHPVGKVERLETHISWIFLTGPYAYKVKKPVKLGFLDFGSLEARRHYCEEELRLNRRLTPDLYLDVVEIRGVPAAPHIAGQGPILEYAVRMRQFDQGALASRVLANQGLQASLVARLAARIADFHAQLPPANAECRYGTTESVAHNACENFTQIEALLPGSEDHQALSMLREWTEREFVLRHAALRNRRSAGRVRECHGDLHLGNIVLLAGELVPFDCIEFNPELRWSDVMSEVAFLVMDLLDRGATRLAWHFLNGYLETSGDYEGLPVLPFFLVYRAIVRAKVHLIRATQAAEPAARERLLASYRDYVRLAQECTGHSPAAILLMHGLAGCGKSTIAQELAQTWGAICIRSDVERKRLEGLRPVQHSASPVAGGLYTHDITRATYARLTQLARTVLEAGNTVIVDATFLQRWQRTLLRDLADGLGVPIAILTVQTPEKILRQRIDARAARGTDPSEATEAVLAYQATIV
ncbi:MAG TPA: AAA family ATPase, partial [Burkholderiales bacterium]|nr:AAA family ATPase [Burkholderiales bacterium]